MAAEIVVGGSGKRTAVPRVCTQQRRPLLGIEWKLSALPTLTCCLPVARVGKVPLAPVLEGRRYI